MPELQKQLDFLLKKYSIGAKGEISRDNCYINTGGSDIKLLPHRSERRFAEMISLLKDGSVEGISSYRAMNISPENIDIYNLAEREIDLCEYILDDTITEVFAVMNNKSMNLLLKTNKGYIATIELAASLKTGEKRIDKHEIIAQKGVVCDKVVDSQVPQESVYVFNNEGNSEFTDVDYELYGLDFDSVSVIRHCFEILKSDTYRDEIANSAGHIKKVCMAVEESIKLKKNIIL